jgi:hypothetical protein
MWQGELNNHMAQGTELLQHLRTFSDNQTKSQHPDRDMLAFEIPHTSPFQAREATLFRMTPFDRSS